MKKSEIIEGLKQRAASTLLLAEALESDENSPVLSACLFQKAATLLENSDEVKHGRWERLDETHSPDCVGRHCCSLCHELAKEWRGREQLTNYCPRCGAKMDEGEEV